ncbi:MAG TPA: SUF system NifU family Fe-S cluster assembly protein [Lentisphaeria bacterium]|jgi:nitrogen fixation NifU-like protein|nr:SUF system NifU family Fe-S cluster assembly protein [Lentisphaeria bacterium]
MSMLELYQEVILDHNKSPRNFRDMDCASHKACGKNPLCGDELDLFLNIEDGVIQDVSFTGTGCAISVASASLLTEKLKGRTVTDAEAIYREVHMMLTGESDVDPAELGKLAVLSGVCQFPVRVKCASLAWHTMHAALQDRSEDVSTE